MKEFKLHLEAGDVYMNSFVGQINEMRQKGETVNLKDVFNCDESGFFYQMAPERTIAPSSFSDRKSQKARFTFLRCCNADVSEKIPLIFIGVSHKSRCFKKNCRRIWALLQEQ